MKQVSNHSSIQFKQVFFDEALDGLDEVLKVKAYRLLQAISLDYDSVFVVEHSNELKNMFSNKLLVHLIEGNSEIVREN